MDKQKCKIDCVYFPSNLYLDKKYISDENEVKHNIQKFHCIRDNHLITKWKNCKYYLSLEDLKKNKLFIFLGKSAAGKDCAINYLISKYNIHNLVSHTSRPIRDGEQEGVNYYFVDKEEFDSMIKNNSLVEYRSYNTMFDGQSACWYYGVSKKELEANQNRICAVDLQGFDSLTRENQNKKIISIYIDCDDKLREFRAKLRGSFSKTEWDRRLADDEIKFSAEELKKRNIDYVINNNKDIDSFYKALDKIMQKENM